MLKQNEKTKKVFQFFSKYTSSDTVLAHMHLRGLPHFTTVRTSRASRPALHASQMQRSDAQIRCHSP